LEGMFQTLLRLQVGLCRDAMPSVPTNVFRRCSSATSASAMHNPATERKMTALELQHLARKGKKIAMITAYDYPSVRR